ncbi:endo-alpha-N-acetylgalactosaminidase family protein [Planctomycetota bacterium]
MDPEPSGEYYDYTVTMKPERPWLLPYHQTLIYRTFNCSRDGEGNMEEVFLTFEQTLEVIERLYHLTCGVPQVVYVTGWQFEGHDSKYPSWAEVNRHLKRPQDEAAVDSLRWLMREARKYNCRVSLHLNMFDAYKDSPLWDEYVEKDIIAKDLDGNPIQGNVWSGMACYHVSYTQEWKHGLAQKRIDGLIAMLPELVDSATIQIDAFLGARKADQQGPISPYLGYTKQEEAATQRKIYRYWRDRGIDVTSEWVLGIRVDHFVGLQPWAFASSQRHLIEDLPNELYCISPMGVEFRAVPEDPAKLLEQFCLEFMPWYYDNNNSPKGDQQMVDGTDTCMPALWCEEETVIAYSKEGYDRKTWELPPDWRNVDRVCLSRITPKGHEPVGEAPVADGRIALSVGKDEALKIRPCQ